METQNRTQIIIVVIVLLVLAGGAFVYMTVPEEPAAHLVPREEATTTPAATGEPTRAVVGTSVEGREIEAFTYGEGETQLLFVGGIHGGYEWNSVLLAYRFMDLLEADPDILPDDLSVTVVPSANPDGVYDVIGMEGRFALSDVPADEGPVGTGRFNANGVDLNRNFDCKWQPESMWRGEVVSAGTEAFSEPEAAAIRDLVYTQDPVAVVFWHSQSNAVYASECEEGVLPETRTLMHTYGDAAGYPKVESFDHYEITGDAEGWLASIGIPAITVELSTHETLEWEKNRAGAEALFSLYSRTESE